MTTPVPTTPDAVFTCPDCRTVLLIVFDQAAPGLPDEMATKVDGHTCPDREPPPRPHDADCECVYSCADDPATACSLSGEWHVHPDLGPCPAHPDAPGDR